ncbi:CotH kinase family protein [Flavobacterium sp.]
MKIKFTLLLFLLQFSLLYGQSLYDANTIQEIRITFMQTNWDSVLDAAEASDAYTAAQSVSINGTIFNNVGVKYKGNSSYNANQTKNPFHIELDAYINQDYQGYTDIKLNNVIFDPTFVREVTAFNVVRKYMHAPLANYANVYVNNVLIGLYTNVESISKKFVSTHFGSNNNAFFSCSPPAGAGPQTTNLPNLAYIGLNSASYESAYEIKSTNGWVDLIDLTNTLSNNINNLEQVLDVDRIIWMLALDNVMVNLDSYIGQFKQNYYLYKDDNGRFNPVMWDLNMSFGTFAMTGSGAPLNSTTSKRQLSHILHSTESSWPLVQKLLAVPSYKKKYLAHYKTILTENFSNNSYYSTAQGFQSLITASVTADVNKFYTNAQFISNMTTDLNVGNNTAPGLSNLMPGRASYLSALSDFTATQPSITNIALSTTNPVLASTVSITATITNATASSVYLGHRVNSLVPFTKVILYDDGAHNDGAAGDNVYGNLVPVNAISTQYYIYAENNTIGKFSPERAEHEFYNFTASYPLISVGDVKINEVLAQSTFGATDEMGQYEDWIELYNTTNIAINLAGYNLSDNVANLTKWQFPLNSIIPAHGYMIVWADGDTTDGPLHASWKLSSTGESVTLATPDQVIIDQVVYDIQTSDMGYARIPNGTGNFVIQTPTFNANNESLSVTSIADFNHNLVYYPNPTNALFYIKNNSFEINDVKIFNLQGQLLFHKVNNTTNSLEIDFSNYSKGMYLVKVNDKTTLKIIKN